MFSNRLLLSFLFSAAAVLLVTYAASDDLSSDDVMKIVNEAKLNGGNGPKMPPGMPGMPGGMPDLPPSDPPAKPKKAKREKKKKTSNKKKSAKDWNKLDMNEMSEDWEDGDDENELEHEYDRIQRVAATKQQEASKVLQSGDSKKIKKVMSSGALDTKGGMVFITLTDTQPDGSPWETKFQDLMCGRWTALLRTASLQANVYNMEPGQVLLQVDKGWMFNDVMRFVMTQPEVVKGYKDGKDFLPSMFTDDEL